MELTVHRRFYGLIEADGYRWPTIGQFVGLDKPVYSIEDPWNNNIPFNSCVPDGEYDLVPYSSPKYPDTWALVNQSLGIYYAKKDIPAGVVARFACLLHVANFEDDIEGCMGPGLDLTIMTDKVDKRPEVSVGQSGPAMAYLRDLLKKEPKNTLVIKPFPGAVV